MDNTVFSDNQRWVFIQNQDTWFKSYIFFYLFSKNVKLLSILIFTAWYLRKLFPPQTNTIKKAIATFYLTMLFFFSLNIINEPNTNSELQDIISKCDFLKNINFK